MQANLLTLAVDTLNNNTPSNEVFSRLEEQLNKTTYRGPGHTVASVNQMQLFRALPKRSGNYLGSLKADVKFTKAIQVTDAAGASVSAPEIGNISFSLPVGDTAAHMKALRQRMIAILDDDAIMDALCQYGEI